MNAATYTRDERSTYFQYLEDISAIPLLTPAQEKVLIKKVKEGSREALDLLVKSNLRFVVNIANLYTNTDSVLIECSVTILANLFDVCHAISITHIYVPMTIPFFISEHHSRHRRKGPYGPHQRREGTDSSPVQQEGR